MLKDGCWPEYNTNASGGQVKCSLCLTYPGFEGLRCPGGDSPCSPCFEVSALKQESGINYYTLTNYGSSTITVDITSYNIYEVTDGNNNTFTVIDYILCDICP